VNGIDVKLRIFLFEFIKYGTKYALVASSFSLLAPAIVSYKTMNYDIASMCALLTFVSSYYHYTKNHYLLYIDYPLNQVIHLTTLYRIIPGGWYSMPVYSIWLFYVVFIYYYGYIHKTIVWNPDYEKATPWHVSLHLSTSIMSSYCIYVTHLIR